MEIDVPLEIEEFLKNFSKDYYTFLIHPETSKARLKCLVTNHEMELKLDAVKTHFQGKKFLKKCTTWKKDFDFGAYEPHIVANRFDDKKLYCNLTKTGLNKVAGEVLKHVRGRKYQAALMLLNSKRGFEEEHEEKSDIEDELGNDVDFIGEIEEGEEGEGEGEEGEEGEEQEERDEYEVLEETGKRALVLIDDEGGVVYQRKKRKKDEKKKKKKKKKKKR